MKEVVQQSYWRRLLRFETNMVGRDYFLVAQYGRVCSWEKMKKNPNQ